LGIPINCLEKKPTFENRPPWVRHQTRGYTCASGGMHNDAPSNSFKNSNANLNVKTLEEEGIGARSYNILCGSPQGLNPNDVLSRFSS